MFLIKPSVNGQGVQGETWYAIGVASEIYQTFNATLVVTSLTDGNHMEGSKHALGFACDLRTSNLTEGERLQAFNALRGALDRLGFDVVWEGGVGATPHTTGAHIHIEFDPKPGQSFLNTLK